MKNIQVCTLVSGKICSRCGEWKDSNAFHKDPYQKTGLCVYCQKCAKVIRKNRRPIKPRPAPTDPALWLTYRRAIVSASVKKWKSANPERQRIYGHAHRTQQRTACGSYTPEEWSRLCEKYDHRCLCCGQSKPLERDHIIPVSKGGSNAIDNIQPLCRTCNAKKKDKSTDYRTDQAQGGIK